MAKSLEEIRAALLDPGHGRDERVDLLRVLIGDGRPGAALDLLDGLVDRPEVEDFLPYLVRTYGHLRHPEAARRVERFLSHPDPDVVENAMKSLVDLDPGIAVRKARRILKKSPLDIAYRVGRVLARRCPQTAEPVFMSMAFSTRSRHRGLSLLFLSGLPEDESVPILLELFRRERRPSLRSLILRLIDGRASSRYREPLANLSQELLAKHRELQSILERPDTAPAEDLADVSFQELSKLTFPAGAGPGDGPPSLPLRGLVGGDPGTNVSGPDAMPDPLTTEIVLERRRGPRRDRPGPGEVHGPEDRRASRGRRQEDRPGGAGEGSVATGTDPAALHRRRGAWTAAGVLGILGVGVMGAFLGPGSGVLDRGDHPAPGPLAPGNVGGATRFRGTIESVVVEHKTLRIAGPGGRRFRVFFLDVDVSRFRPGQPVEVSGVVRQIRGPSEFVVMGHTVRPAEETGSATFDEDPGRGLE